MAWAKYVRVFLLLACAAIVTGVSRNPRDAKGRSPRANGEVELHVASDPWNSTGIKGVQYNPSYSMNSIMTWCVAGSALPQSLQGVTPCCIRSTKLTQD